MICGTGVDIVEIERIAAALERHEGRMKRRLFTDHEREYCEARHTAVLHYAARFAAKEAFSKAVGTGMTRGLGWKDVGVENLPSGEPRLELSERAMELMAERGAKRAHITLSHSHTVAVAFVVIED
ncbi:holo-ACP synthase [bacterium]|nr:holo-ACP synthase [bacterium]